MNAGASLELEHIWSCVQGELAREVEDSTYRIWLEPLTARDLSGGHLQVEAPPEACAWIHKRFGHLLQATIARVIGEPTVLELLPRSTSRNQGPLRDEATATQDPHDRQGPPPSREGALGNPKLTFDQFVIGDCNHLAHAAALAVAEMPAQAYNPLFLYGPPGVGKTHLLSSIASLVLSHNPGLAVRCTTGEAFTNDFLAALVGRKTDYFKARFRDIDILLMDDVQFLERKTKTEEEFFHTFNALHDAGRQIVITSDRPPRDLQALEDRLRERFEAGLVADIRPPELATRIAILRKRVHNDGISVEDELVLTALAQRVPDNVRALEGALIRVVAFSSLTGRPLTADLAHEVLDSLRYDEAHGQSPGPRSVAEIQAAVGKHFGVSVEELLSSSRTARVAWPRQVAMYLTRELTPQSLPAIGQHFGGRDHTTVLYAWRRARARMSADETAHDDITHLRARLNVPSTAGTTATARPHGLTD